MRFRKARDGVSPAFFCCGCITFLSAVLTLQVFVLVSLVRHRASEQHEPVAAVATSGLSPAGLPLAPQTLQSNGFREHRGLAIGVAIGMGADSIVLFLLSLLRTSPTCRVVILSDWPLSPQELQAVGVDPDRVSFELVMLPLPQPWNAFHISSARFWLLGNYLEVNVHKSDFDLVLVSDLQDLVFQVDPFAWVAAEPSGVQVFGEHGGSLGGDARLRSLLVSCYGHDVLDAVSQETPSSTALIIGTVQQMRMYLKLMADDLIAKAGCREDQVEKVVHNVIVHRASSGLAVHVHTSVRGPVWAGGSPSRGLKLSGTGLVVHEDGTPYVVLHQYSLHEELAKRLRDNLLGGRTLGKAEGPCSLFDVAPGDLPGLDLTHVEAETLVICCEACLADMGCGGFVFSSRRKHCWMKEAGATRQPPGSGDDIVCAVRRGVSR